MRHQWNPRAAGPVRIKICGLKTAGDVESAVEAGADAIGLVLAEGSPRTVSTEQAAALAACAGERLATIALMVNPAPAQLEARPAAWLQLHGSESESLVAQAALMGPVIKAVPHRDIEAITFWDADPNVQLLLIDSPRGGSGQPFDHAALAPLAASLRTPWILAGGLTPETVGAAIQTLRPWGVDVSSGVESSRGVKDAARMRAFCEAVHAASPH
ncbi:MAG: phosphoribosylanthranilate isomerase [Phycisphaerales bacterium]|nr:phosphoribosylanthranilate isomerase [Phycisphaerales bacterium]